MNRFELQGIYKMLLENMPCPVWIGSLDYKIIFINKQYEDTYNVNLEDVIGKTIEDIFHKDIAYKYTGEMRKVIESKNTSISQEKVNGVYLECTAFPLLDGDNEIKAVAGIIINIDDKVRREKKLENQGSILRTIIDAVPETIFYKDKESKFIGYNKLFKEFYLEKGVKDILGKTDIDIYPDRAVAEEFIRQDKEIMEQKEAKYYEFEIKNPDGTIRVDENVKIPVIDNDGEAWGIVCLSRDITERKVLEKNLRYLSETDILTGLYNRNSFEEKLKFFDNEKYFPLGIIFGDVNGLKLVNDTLGHFEGDKVLKNISDVLKNCCGKECEIFRWGGDEFVILAPSYNDSKCEALINRIVEKCSGFQSEFIKLSIALGEAVKNNVDEDVYECINKAEENVYRKKLLEKKSFKSSVMESLNSGLQEKSMETREHTDRITNYAIELGKILKFKIAELDELIITANLHDIGKIGINEEILLKPGKLTNEEFEIMKTHTEKGYRIINASSELDNVAKAVLTHHERWDGNGYPLGLKGEEIPLMARIINIVDSYDVMTSDRVYKKAISEEMAIEELKRCSGTQFDPKLVEKFIEYIQVK